MQHLRRAAGWASNALVAIGLGVLAVRAGAQGNEQGNQAPAGPAHAALSPATGLSLLDVLQASLAKNPQLKIATYTVAAQSGVVRTAKGQFDWTLAANGSQQHAYTPLTPVLASEYGVPGGSGVDSIVANTSTVSASAAKEFRNGISVSPSLEATRSTDNVLTQDGINESHVGLAVTLPVLRNRGRSVVDAQETSARQVLEATRMDLSQLVSDTLATAASRYWNFVAADATLAVYKASEARGSDLLNGTETLVKADRLPANDLNQVRANLADRIASRTAAEQSLLQARQQLVLVMGLGPDQILSLPAPAQDIPDATAPYDASRLAGYLQLANTKRADVLAARLRRDANRTLENAAVNQLKPQLDVSSSVGYTGLREGTNVLDYPRSVGNSPKGADVTVGITYSQSPANNAARGRLETAMATTRQSDVTLSETARTAATAVVVAYEGVRSTTMQLQRAHEAVRYYQAALDGEKEKYRLGLNSLVDVLTVEDRLTTGVLAEVNARLAYALALVTLRQSTGTIVQAGQDVQQVDPLLFSSLP
ncbi:TolC family protein [Granulicella sibirica]|nr:TolC family protein [Granulicella sibirica]